MSQENVELLREGVAAWNRHDAALWLSHAAPDVEWLPAGPAAVERAVYRGYDEVANGITAAFETWDVFAFRESELRDLGDSALWLGRVMTRGSASGVELDQEFAIHWMLREGKLIRIQAFLSWQDALKAIGMAE